MKMAFNWRYILIGLMAFIIFLVMQFPAERAYVMWKRGPGAGQPVVLSGVSGNIWNGQAQRALINGQRLESLKWHLKPWTVLLGNLEMEYEIRLKDGFLRGNVAADPQGAVVFDSLEAKVPLAQLADKTLAALRPTGVVNLNLHNVNWSGQTLLSAEGRIVWSSAGISLLQALEFGDLSLTLQNRDDAVVGELSDGGGPLQAEGLLTIQADGSYQFTGSFAAREGARSPLGRALSTLGRAGADGKIAVSHKGTLADLGLVPVQR